MHVDPSAARPKRRRRRNEGKKRRTPRGDEAEPFNGISAEREGRERDRATAACESSSERSGERGRAREEEERGRRPSLPPALRMLSQPSTPSSVSAAVQRFATAAGFQLDSNGKFFPKEVVEKERQRQRREAQMKRAEMPQALDRTAARNVAATCGCRVSHPPSGRAWPRERERQTERKRETEGDETGGSKFLKRERKKRTRERGGDKGRIRV
jgi:hypothetical protein